MSKTRSSSYSPSWWEECDDLLGEKEEREYISSHPVITLFDKLTDVVGQKDDITAAFIKELLKGTPHVGSFAEDLLGNYFLDVPMANGERSRTMFCAHLDTVAWGKTKVQKTIGIQNGNHIMGTWGDSILGADDRAGCAILVYMIQNNIPGTYAFFTDEESGRLGSEDYAERYGEAVKGMYDRAIQFDRYGYSSVINMQSGDETASLEFSQALSDALNAREWPGVNAEGESTNFVFCFEPDPTGSYTDTYSLRGLIPECTNISVGYFDQHMKNEHQDLDFLRDLATVCIELDWESLPTVRTPIKVSKWDYPSRYYRNGGGKYRSGDSYGKGYAHGGGWPDDDDYYDPYELYGGRTDASQEDIDAVYPKDASDIESMPLNEIMEFLVKDFPDEFIEMLSNMADYSMAWQVRDLAADLLMARERYKA